MIEPSAPERSTLVVKDSKRNSRIQAFLRKSSSSNCSLYSSLLFVCQIAFLILPIAVLYGGLYLVSSTASIVAVACGSMVLTFLCILMFAKPFSNSDQELQDEESEPLVEDATPSAEQSIDIKIMQSFDKSTSENFIQKLFPSSKTKRPITKKADTLRDKCSRDTCQAATTSSERSFLSDVEEGKYTIRLPCNSSGSDDDRMDLLNMNEKVLSCRYYATSRLQNIESNRRNYNDFPNYGLGDTSMCYGMGRAPLGTGKSGKIEKKEISCVRSKGKCDDSIQSAVISKGMNCSVEPLRKSDKGDDGILIRLFPTSSKMGMFELERTPELPEVTASTTAQHCKTGESSVTLKIAPGVECQTSKCFVDASCDVVFVNEKKNVESQTSWLDVMKAENMNQIMLREERDDFQINRKLIANIDPNRACRISPEMSKYYIVEEKESGKREHDNKSPAKSKNSAHLADNISIVDFVLRGRFPVPKKPSTTSPLPDNDVTVEMKSREVKTVEGVHDFNKIAKTPLRKEAADLDVSGSGATVSSYHTSGDRWDTENNSKKKFVVPRYIWLDDAKASSKNNKQVEQSMEQIPQQARSFSKNICFQPRKFGLLATESSIEDVRRKELQMQKPRMKPKFNSMSKSPRIHGDALEASAPKPSKSLELCSPPRKVQRTFESPRAKHQWGNANTKNETKFYRIHSAVGSGDNSEPKNHTTAHVNFGVSSETGRHFENSTPKRSENKANKTTKNVDESPKKNIPNQMDDNSDNSSISESLRMHCGSRDKGLGRSKTKTANSKRGVSRVESTIFRKSSSSYDNVIIERVLKQKKKTLKKFT